MAGYAALPGSLYIILARSRQVACEVRVNDVLIYYSDGRAAESYTEKVNPLLQRGRNTLAVTLSNVRLPPGELQNDGQSAAPQTSPEFRLTLRLGRQGVKPAESQQLASFEWRPATAPLPPSGSAEVFRQLVDIPGLAYEPRWLQAAPTAISDEQVRQFVRQYADLLRRRAFPSVLAANRFKFEELGRSLGLDPQNLLNGMDQYLTRLAAVENYAVRETEGVAAMRESEGRLVSIVGPHYSAPIIVRSGDGEFSFPLQLANLDGQWQIVR